MLADAVAVKFHQAAYSVERSQKLTHEDWDELSQLIESRLPRLHASIDNDERLTPEQKKLVLLVRLRFKNNEISNLLSLTPQMVTNRIALLNKRLYGRDSAKGFYENLSNYLPLCT